ncbi:hypothetical protein KEM54_005988 [Ascosphaera aggregata]|nr:hypothetical protein KEM54_005988 [Ascosphaera aggregata]
MAKIRTHKKKSTDKKKKAGKHAIRAEQNPTQLLEEGSELLQLAQPDRALDKVKEAFELLPEDSPFRLPGLNLLGEIFIELGLLDSARIAFLKAVELDPQGEIPVTEGGGAEKFLMLAEISPEGGEDSVRWFEKGVSILRTNIQKLEGKQGEEETLLREDYKSKLATALCSVAEIYMTDLSFDPNAEARCESLVTEAVMIAPESPEVLQTLANVRISQLKIDDARAALTRSLAIWKDLPPENPLIPSFAARVSLVRLLIEVEMEAEAIDVIENMILEDDQSVETWYLGGWSLYLIGKGRETDSNDHPKSKMELDPEARLSTLQSSVRWFKQSLKLYEQQKYEDERLKEHAEELVHELEKEIGEVPEEDAEEVILEVTGSDGEWENASDDDGDDQMRDA